MSNFGGSSIRCPMCSLPSANMGWGFACADSVAGDADAKTSPRSEGVQGLWQRFSEGCEDNPMVCWGNWDWGWWRSPKWRGRWKPFSGQRHSCQSSHMLKTHSKAPSYLLLNSRCPARPSLIGETPAYNYPSLISYLNRKNLLFKKFLALWTSTMNMKRRWYLFVFRALLQIFLLYGTNTADGWHLSHLHRVSLWVHTSSCSIHRGSTQGDRHWLCHHGFSDSYILVDCIYFITNYFHFPLYYR